LQLAVVLSGASQPLNAMKSQLPKPLSHAPRVQVPAAQLSLPLASAQVELHAPQFVSEFSGVSQPLVASLSQSPKPALQAIRVQLPDEHVVAALACTHAVLQPPQLTLVFVGVSQPLV
jgi:hypothetical protein